MHFCRFGSTRIERRTRSCSVNFVTYPRTGTFLQIFEIPLPPLEEQRRIAAILDAADRLRTKRRQALAKLDTLTQAIFIDMFGDPAKSDGSACGLTDLAELQIGYPFKSSTFTGTEEGDESVPGCERVAGACPLEGHRTCSRRDSYDSSGVQAHRRRCCGWDGPSLD